jgi:DNA-binding CsgD family transcriptional regulator
MASDPHVDEVFAAALNHVRALGRVVVVGTGGIGKSTLVTRIVDELAPDELIAVAADLVEDVARVQSAVLDSLGEATLAGDSAEALMEAAVVGRRVAIVVDGADSVVDDVLSWSAQVPADGNGPWVVVASRVHPLHVVSPVVHLGPLSLRNGSEPSYAERLFRAWYTDAGGAIDQLDAAPDALQRVLATTGGVPLAIRVAAATSAAVGLDAGEMVIADGARSDAVAVSIERSVSLLSPSERELFDAFAVSSGAIDIELAAEIVGRDPKETAVALGTLARHNLVDVDAGEYTMLPPVMRFATANASDSASLARTRHRSWCLSMTTLSDYEAVMLRREPDVRIAIDDALTSDPTVAADLAAFLVKALLGALQPHRASELLTAVLASRAIVELEPADRRLELMRLLAITERDTRGVAAGDRVLNEAEHLVVGSDRPEWWHARLLALRAGHLTDSGRTDEAVAASMRAAEIAMGCGDAFNALQVRHFAVTMLWDLGRLDEADDLAASVIAECTDDARWIEHQARNHRGQIALERGDRARSIATGRRLASEAGDDLFQAMDAEYLLILSDPVTYAPAITAALTVAADRPGEWEGHLQAQTCVTIAALVAGDAEQAMTVASDIVVVAEALPLYWLLLSGLLLLGDASLLCGDQSQALAAYREALTRANQRAHVLRSADAIDGLARLTPVGEGRRLALMAAAELRRASGAARRPRPWLPSLATPRGRGGAGTAPTDWMNGQRMTDTGVAAIIASATASLNAGLHTSTDSIAQLSPAERRVAELVADGLTNREIGERLHIARRTVETHIVHSFQKLGVQNRTQLARLVAD